MGQLALDTRFDYAVSAGNSTPPEAVEVVECEPPCEPPLAAEQIVKIPVPMFDPSCAPFADFPRSIGIRKSYVGTVAVYQPDVVLAPRFYWTDAKGYINPSDNPRPDRPRDPYVVDLGSWRFVEGMSRRYTRNWLSDQYQAGSEVGHIDNARTLFRLVRDDGKTLDSQFFRVASQIEYTCFKQNYPANVHWGGKTFRCDEHGAIFVDVGVDRAGFSKAKLIEFFGSQEAAFEQWSLLWQTWATEQYAFELPRMQRAQERAERKAFADYLGTNIAGAVATVLSLFPPTAPLGYAISIGSLGYSVASAVANKQNATELRRQLRDSGIAAERFAEGVERFYGAYAAIIEGELLKVERRQASLNNAAKAVKKASGAVSGGSPLFVAGAALLASFLLGVKVG